MSLIDYVLDHDVYNSIAQDLSEEDRKDVELKAREMLENIDEIYIYLKDALNTEEGIEELMLAFEHVISKEGQEEWQGKS